MCRDVISRVNLFDSRLALFFLFFLLWGIEGTRGSLCSAERSAWWTSLNCYLTLCWSEPFFFSSSSFSFLNSLEFILTEFDIYLFFFSSQKWETCGDVLSLRLWRKKNPCRFPSPIHIPPLQFSFSWTSSPLSNFTRLFRFFFSFFRAANRESVKTGWGGGGRKRNKEMNPLVLSALLLLLLFLLECFYSFIYILGAQASQRVDLLHPRRVI